MKVSEEVRENGSAEERKFIMQNTKTKAYDYRDICRVRVSLFAAFSAGCGFLLAFPRGQWKIILVLCGVFLLACGSSGLNQYQERETDALMPRTKNRPIPSGRMEPVQGLLFSALLAGAGIIILSAGCGLLAAALGLLAAAWYNGVYTCLKKKSAFSAVPGALTGALTPAVGWAAAGGGLSEPRLLVLCFFFAIWQVPHFWLFLMSHGEEYEDAGFPSLTRVFQPGQIARIVFHWIAATAVSGLILCLFGLAQSSLVQYLLLCASAWLVWQGVKFIRSGGSASSQVFGRLNLYMIIVMILLSADTFVHLSHDYLSNHWPVTLQKFCSTITAALL